MINRLREFLTLAGARYIGLALLLLGLVFLLRGLFRLKKKLELARWARSNFMNIGYIRRLDGLAFENYVEGQLRALGLKVERTSASYDFGVDLLVNDHYAIQLKNYTNTVGIGAIQEIYAGAAYYGRVPVVLVTNYYTKSAIELAQALDIELIDLDDIKNWGNRYYRRSFDHELGLYELVEGRLVKGLKREIVS